MSCLIKALNQFAKLKLKEHVHINPDAFNISYFFIFDKEHNISSKLTKEDKEARAKTILDWFKLLTDMQSDLACNIAECDATDFRYMLEGIDKSVLEKYEGPFMQIKRN
jgi:predicted nucleotidyltransferase component of viral defense system